MKKVNILRGTGKKILIVEDDKDFISILETKFSSEGFSVATAEDGEQGVSEAEKQKPDLILSDVLMSKMDGIEMAKRIKEAGNKVPIVFLTNINDVDYTKGIEKFGEFDYLIKSELRIEEIVKIVKTKLGIK